MTGQTFGRWTVFELAERDKYGHLMCRCLCTCGTERVVMLTNLRLNKTRSCGCYDREVAAARLTTHGDSKSREYNIWLHIKGRCHRPTDKQFRNYGGRGIRVCKRWRESFENFLADMGRCPEGLSIERMDNNRGYEPNNCKWATSAQQSRNTRANRWIKFRGERHILSDWAKIFGVSPGRLCTALNHEGKTMETFSQRRKWVRRGVNGIR